MVYKASLNPCLLVAKRLEVAGLTDGVSKAFAIERECLAIVCGIKYFCPYLFGKEFDDDHNPLRWLDNARDPHSRLSRWSLTLQSYSFQIKHRSGKHHHNANALSRIPPYAECNDIKNNDIYVSAVDVPGLQLDRVKCMQEQDRSLGELYDYFDKSNVHVDSKEACKLMATSEDYVMEDGILYHVDKVILSCHEEVTSGHLGFEKTYLRILRRFFWPGMYPDIGRWCSSCVNCATKKTPCNIQKAPLQPIPVEGPFDRVAVDVLGPFPNRQQIRDNFH